MKSHKGGEELGHFAQGRRIAAGKGAPLGTGACGERPVLTGGMEQTTAVLFEAIVDERAKLREVFDTDMLEHTDRDKGIKAAADVAGVLLDKSTYPSNPSHRACSRA